MGKLTKQMIMEEASRTKIVYTEGEVLNPNFFVTGGYTNPNTPNGGYPDVGGFGGSPTYYLPNTPFYPIDASYNILSLRNKEGQQISMQVDMKDNTVRIDVDALMELMRMAGFE